MSERTVGFIGLGIMGVPMATNLVRAGFDVVVWARRREAVDELVGAGARAADDVDAVLAAAETVVLMLRDESAVDSVLKRGTAAFPGLVADHTIVQMGTFTTAFSERLEADVRDAGGRYVEAPVSGSRGPAVDGSLVAMLAGSADAIDHVGEVIAAMCAQTFRCGDVPAALTMKLAVNTYLITMVTGLAETFHFAKRSGVDVGVLRDVLDAGPMASAVLRGKAEKLVTGDLTPQATIADVLKNAVLAEGAAETVGSSHPLISASRQVFQSALDAGLGALDMIGVSEAFTSGHTVIRAATPDDFASIVRVWRASVEATHHFLTPAEVDGYETQIRTYLPQMPEVFVATDRSMILGFIGHGDGHIEMLFVHPSAHRRGIGTALIDHVSARFPHLHVDVNEENPGARRFYEARGFTAVGRSETDGEGQPHPLLHLDRPPV